MGLLMIKKLKAHRFFLWDAVMLSAIFALADSDGAPSPDLPFMAAEKEAEAKSVPGAQARDAGEALPKWRLLRTFTHPCPVAEGIFFKNDTRILTRGYDNIVRRWNPATGQVIGPVLTHGGFVRGAAFSKDERKS